MLSFYDTRIRQIEYPYIYEPLKYPRPCLKMNAGRQALFKSVDRVRYTVDQKQARARAQ